MGSMRRMGQKRDELEGLLSTVPNFSEIRQILALFEAKTLTDTHINSTSKTTQNFSTIPSLKHKWFQPPSINIR